MSSVKQDELNNYFVTKKRTDDDRVYRSSVYCTLDALFEAEKARRNVITKKGKKAASFTIMKVENDQGALIFNQEDIAKICNPGAIF